MTSRCQHIYRRGSGNRFGSLVDYRSQVELRAGATMRPCLCEHDEVNKRTRLNIESIGEKRVDTYLAGPGHQVARQCGIFLDIDS